METFSTEEIIAHALDESLDPRNRLQGIVARLRCNAPTAAPSATVPSSFEEWWKANEKQYSADACHMSEYHMASVVWEAASAQRSSTRRTDADYAIEFGGYLAKAAEDFLTAWNLVGELDLCGVEGDALDAATDALGDHSKGLRSAVYEFKKRAERAKDAGVSAIAPTVNPLQEHYDKLAAEVSRLQDLINSPEIDLFLRAVHLEAVHQIERWGTTDDRAKRPADWFWLIGYLAGKALHSQVGDNTEKALHHCISTAAALYNWHCAIKGVDVRMCPGSSDVERIVEAAFPGAIGAMDGGKTS